VFSRCCWLGDFLFGVGIVASCCSCCFLYLLFEMLGTLLLCCRLMIAEQKLGIQHLRLLLEMIVKKSSSIADNAAVVYDWVVYDGMMLLMKM